MTKSANILKDRSELIFDEKEHAFYVNGVRLISVTQILRISGMTFNYSSSEERDLHLLRGKLVHKACELLDLGELNWKSVDPLIEPYVRAYQRFKIESDFICDLIEQPYYHQLYRFATILDRTGQFPDSEKKVLLEIKTGSLDSATALQLAGQELALNDNGFTEPFERRALVLSENGSYKLQEPYTNPKDRVVFLSALNCAIWKIEHGKAKL